MSDNTKRVRVLHEFDVNIEATEDEIEWIVVTMTIQVEEPIDEEGDKARHIHTKNIRSSHTITAKYGAPLDD